MKSSKFKLTLGFALTCAAFTFSLAVRAQAQTETVLYTFGSGSNDGHTPDGGLIFDSAGNLYGTTSGDAFSIGTVFELSPAAGGGWTEQVLYRFTGGSDGGGPEGSLAMDSAGNLYGATTSGGPSCVFGGAGCGVVFELSPSSGGTWTETILYSFTGGNDGARPLGGVVLDAAGNLYGTTSLGGHTFSGSQTAGVVFQLVHNSSGGWTENSIHLFSGHDGAQPASTLIFDAAGNLYGTSQEGGPTNSLCSIGCGVVFKLTPTSSGTWTEKIIHTFNVQNGANPYAGVIFDAAGNLYGTTQSGGTKKGYGAVFELSPNSAGGWQQSRLFKFMQTNGALPYAGVVVSPAGNVYGTTFYGGDLTTCGNTKGCGVAYELTPTPTGWTQTLLHVFGTTTTDGIHPLAGLTLDGSGNLYGTTEFGGPITFAFGTVFEITP